jgi:predicted enzyme related to lactoylglutathione lyase
MVSGIETPARRRATKEHTMHADAPVAPVGWFEIAASDTAKAEAFYSELFNWTFADGPTGPAYRLAQAGDGIPGGMTTAQANLPRTYAIFSIVVSDVAATCARIEQLGGRVLVGPETMGETGLAFANVEDPDGNHFGIFSPPAG